ncbi:MAG: hypothetical protein KBT12_00090 [Bacteroidales bacterium]|nr:hypothetical protein [Candidatus Physcousia equi]
MINKELLNKAHLDNLLEYCEQVPYDVLRTELYHPGELFECYEESDPSSFCRCYDTRVYNHLCQTGRNNLEVLESATRNWHDYTIRQALARFMGDYRQHHVVGIMGGHQLLRNDAPYRQVVEIAKTLTEQGFLMLSGGGPGAMEATHLGAWLAGRDQREVDEAIEILSRAPSFQDDGWFARAYEVTEKFPLLPYEHCGPDDTTVYSHYKSLAIPTWFYGHEPPTVFATDIAKFFDNSQREDLILTESYGGLIFMPGSAGTLQEIFQECVQNHYVTLGYASPMVFVGRKFWTEEIPVYPFLETMEKTGRYKNLLLYLTDSTDDAIRAIMEFNNSFKENHKKNE